jgi:hypothetical protein
MQRQPAYRYQLPDNSKDSLEVFHKVYEHKILFLWKLNESVLEKKKQEAHVSPRRGKQGALS